MRSVLTVIKDENLMQKFRIAHTDSTIRYFYAGNGEEAIRITEDNEIAVCIVDFKLSQLSCAEICETILDNNSRTEIIIVFDEQNISEVLNVYNRYHISKLICKQNFILEDIPKLINDSLHMYNRLDEIKKSDEKRTKIAEKYLKPMQEMSSLLNERMNGYQQVIRTFNDCIKFISGRNEKSLKSLNVFVDRIINDFIQVYMIREPEYNVFLESLNYSYNKPDEKKYFRYTCDCESINDNCIREILMAANLVTIAYDLFYKSYRGKIIVSSEENATCFNCIFEALHFTSEGVEPETIISIIKYIISEYSDRIQFARKDNIMQIKAYYNNPDNIVVGGSNGE